MMRYTSAAVVELVELGEVLGVTGISGLDERSGRARLAGPNPCRIAGEGQGA